LWLLGISGFVLANRGLKNRARERDRAEAELQNAHDELEKRIRERTAELRETNERLQGEIEERNLAEEALRENKRFLDAVFDSIQDGISVIANSSLTKVCRAVIIFYGKRSCDISRCIEPGA